MHVDLLLLSVHNKWKHILAVALSLVCAYVPAQSHASPLSTNDRTLLTTLAQQFTGQPYRVSWTEYHAIPFELVDGFTQAGLTNIIVDSETGLSLYPQYERTFFSDGNGNRRLRTRELTKIGPEQNLDEWIVFNGRSEATIPSGISRRAQLFQYEDPTTSQVQRDAWADGMATYEFMVTLGVYSEVASLAAQRLLESDDAEMISGANGDKKFISNFWGISLTLDSVGRLKSVVQSNPGDPSSRSIRKAHYKVLEYNGISRNADPMLVRKEILWPDESSDWQVNLIAALQPAERGVTLAPNDFDWRTYAETAMDSVTGEIIDQEGRPIGNDTPTVYTAEQLEQMPSPQKQAAKLQKLAPSNQQSSPARTARWALVISGGLLVIGGGVLIVRQRIT